MVIAIATEPGNATFIFWSPSQFSISLILDLNGRWWNLKADILDPRTGIARPLTGVSIGGQAPNEGVDVIDDEQDDNYDDGVYDEENHKAWTVWMMTTITKKFMIT